MTKFNLLFKIQLSKKDKIKSLVLPRYLSEDLSYIVGVLAGDGNIFCRKDKYDYRIKCVGNPLDEKEYYSSILKPLFKRVFNLDIIVKEQDSGTTYGFYIYSKALVRYLTEVFELPNGKKTNRLKIPHILQNSGFIVPFIRGLADTDFCVTYKKNSTYPCIVGSSDSKEFMKEISKELKKLDFKFYEVYGYKMKDSRFKKGYSTINRIEINGKDNLDLWIKKIGFLSPKHLNKIKVIAGSGHSENDSAQLSFEPPTSSVMKAS